MFPIYCRRCDKEVHLCTCSEKENDDNSYTTSYSYDLSRRAEQFNQFADIVVDHIETYTIPQYGDMPYDNASTFTEADFITQIKKYMARMESNVRGPVEAQRDLVKIAHYCGMLYMKRKEEQEDA